MDPSDEIQTGLFDDFRTSHRWVTRNCLAFFDMFRVNIRMKITQLLSVLLAHAVDRLKAVAAIDLYSLTCVVAQLSC